MHTESDQLRQVAIIGHPVWKHAHGSERVRVDSRTCIYFRQKLRFGYRHGIAGRIRDCEVVFWHSCTLGERGVGVCHSSNRGSRVLIFGLCGGPAAGRKWARGDLL